MLYSTSAMMKTFLSYEESISETFWINTVAFMQSSTRMWHFGENLMDATYRFTNWHFRTIDYSTVCACLHEPIFAFVCAFRFRWISFRFRWISCVRALGRNKVKWRPGQKARLGPHGRTGGISKAIALYWKKYLWYFWDLSAPPRSDSAPP